MNRIEQMQRDRLVEGILIFLSQIVAAIGVGIWSESVASGIAVFCIIFVFIACTRK